MTLNGIEEKDNRILATSDFSKGHRSVLFFPLERNHNDLHAVASAGSAKGQAFDPPSFAQRAIKKGFPCLRCAASIHVFTAFTGCKPLLIFFDVFFHMLENVISNSATSGLQFFFEAIKGLPSLKC